MNKRSKNFEKKLKKLNDLKSTYKSLSNELMVGESILKKTYLKIVLFKRAIKKENQSSGLLRELKEDALEYINSTYEDPAQKNEDIQLISEYYDITSLKGGIIDGRKKARELERELNELSDKRMRIRKKIRRYETKIGIEEAKYDDKYKNLL